MPGEEFMETFVRACAAMQLEGFNPQQLSSIIHGEQRPLAALVNAMSVSQSGC
jgi:hypothetical protein